MKVKRALSWVLLVSMLVSMFGTGAVATDTVEAPQETPAVVEPIAEPEVSPEPQPEPLPVVEETPTETSEESEELTSPAETPEETPEATEIPEETPAEAPAETETPTETVDETTEEEPATEEPAVEEPAAEEPAAEENATETVELLPEESTEDDAEQLLAKNIWQHNFKHLDIRISQGTYTVNQYYIDEYGNKVDAGTKTITAYVTNVDSCTINGTTYSTDWYEFGWEGYEYRRDLSPTIKITTSTTATFVVDLKLADGTPMNNVTVFFNNAGVQQAAYNCDGYHGSGSDFDGLDFRIAQGTVSFEVEVEKRTVSVTKVWDDDNNSAGLRPSSVTVNLLADGADTGKSATLSASNNWTYTFTDLAVEDANGDAIAYTVSEVVPANYSVAITGTSSSGYVVTNSYDPEQVTIAGSKTWADNDNQDGLRPAQITIELYADTTNDGVKNGTKEHEQHASASNNWSWSFTVPKYVNGVEVDYYITEVAVPGYTTTVNGYNVTNTHTPETVDISGEKTWDDANNQDGKRPESITIHLYKDTDQDTTNDTLVETVTVKEDDNGDWKWSFTNLPKYEEGEQGVEIYYYIVEDAIPGYSTKVDGYNITNSYTPETVTVAGSKTWYDADNQDGIRPEKVTIILYADGQEIDRKTVSEAENWSGSWENLPKYKNGKEIVYTIDEETVPGYEKVVVGYNVRNYHTPATVDITGTKTWDDANDQDGIRPDYIEIQLWAKVGPNGTAYKVGSPEWISSLDNWSWSFEDLPKYSGGVEIIYYIEEIAVKDYTTTVADVVMNTAGTQGVIDITNKHEPETTKIAVKKVWDDADNQDGLRPTSVTVELVADGAKTGKALNLNQGNNWSGSFEGLAVYGFDSENNGGREIVYTVEELDPQVYTSVLTGSAEEGFTLTNSYTPKTREITVTKVWDDANNQDGYRPDYIEVQLYADNVAKGEPVKIYGSDSYTFTNLPVNKNVNGESVAIDYTVKETMPSNGDKYEASVDYSELADGSVTITNTHDPEKTSLKVTKTWDITGYEDQSIEYPEKIVLNLYGNNRNLHTYYHPNEEFSKYRVEVTPKTVDGKIVWEYEWPELAKYHNSGNTVSEVTYTVFEEELGDWNPNYQRVDANNISITNKYDPEHTYLEVSKIWWDANNQDGKRPEYLAVDLCVVKTPTVTGNGEVKTGVVETVYLGETANSTVKVNGTDVTLKYGSWEYVWPQLDRKETIDNVEYTLTYYVKEHVPVGYSLSVPEDYHLNQNSGDSLKENDKQSAIYNSTMHKWTLINVHTPEVVDISVTKEWNDADNQDGIRPASITVRLLADGVYTDKTITITNAGTATFEDLPKFASGKEIDYTVEEVAVPGYTAVVTGDVTTGYKITNTHEVEKTSISVNKVWNDDSNRDGKRPTEITVELYAGTEKKETKTLTAQNDWTATFDDLPVHANGTEIVYSVKEADNAKAGDETVSLRELKYTSVVDASKIAEGKVTITNSRTPEVVTLSGKKVWNDDSNRDGVRPANLTLNVYADVKDDGKDPIKVREVHLTNASAVSNSDEWTWSIAGLPKYYYEGKEIIYTVEEVYQDSAGNLLNWTKYYNLNEKGEYIPAVTGNLENDFTITNTHVTAKIKISGTKVWDDANDQDGQRPKSITIQLWKEIPTTAVNERVGEKTVSADNNWAWNFGELPLYQDGKRIDYYIVETGVSDTSSSGIAAHDLNDYSTVIYFDYKDENNDGNPEEKNYTVTNIYTPETVVVAGTKEWHDNDNQDGIRPKEITIYLYADGEKIREMTISEDQNGKWGGVFGLKGVDPQGTLPRYKNVNGVVSEIEYTIGEKEVEGYTTAIHGYNIVNTHIPETITITGEKTWDDADNQDGIRPHNIEITLMGKVEGGEPYEVAYEWISGEGDDWKWSFADLPKFEGGKEIKYSLLEKKIEGYTTEITTIDANGVINITNSHETEVIDVSGEKTWDDNNDQDGKRPESITINLMANGEKVDSKTVTEKDGWKWTFEDVDKYADGKEIVYTVTEEAVEGYTATYDGADVTNTHTPETTFLVVSKVWEDDDNRDGLRPESITVTVKANGEAVGEPIVLSEDNSWHKVVADLPVYSEGEKIVYTVTENELDYYTGTVSVKDNVYTITNTHEIETTEITVKKLWKDNDDADGIRPESVKIQLLAGGEKVGEAVDVKDTYTWTDLPVNEDGEAIVYTVEEIDTPKGYEPKYSDLKAGVITITNVHEQETTDIKVTKTWVDNNDAKKARPKNITVQLYANGVEYGAAVTITSDMKWEYTFEDLPANKGGEPIKYTVKEAGVKHYIAKYTVGNNNVLVIKNTYTDIPLTGDTINMLLWSIIGGSAMLSLGGVTVIAKRKKFVK